MKTGIFDKEKGKKEKLSRKVITKIELKQEDKEDGITVEILLNNGVIGLVIS